MAAEPKPGTDTSIWNDMLQEVSWGHTVVRVDFPPGLNIPESLPLPASDPCSTLRANAERRQ
jgi:hypothetical protein